MLISFGPSAIHGTGGFAIADIPAKTRIIEYVGEKIDKQESVRRCEAGNSYIFYFDSEYDLDGNVEGNPARLINHSCDPNCDAELMQGRLWLVSRRDIRAGEEITFNYGYDLEALREHPCRCGATECMGFILAEEFHHVIRRG